VPGYSCATIIVPEKQIKKYITNQPDEPESFKPGVDKKNMNGAVSKKIYINNKRSSSENFT